jgi:hypothetical protein
MYTIQQGKREPDTKKLITGQIKREESLLKHDPTLSKDNDDNEYKHNFTSFLQ